MAQRPIIGVTPSWDAEKAAYRLYANYCSLIEQAGGMPVILPYCFSGVERLSGLVLTGGGDVSAELGGYGDSPLVELDSVAREGMEERVFLEAFHAGVPVLGICRGHQLLNCALGGTLIRDLHEAGIVEEHMRGAGLGPHPIKTVPGSILSGLIGSRLDVWSTHHQAVKGLGRGLSASAYSPEGVIEGLEHENGRVLGLQTHPERMDMLAPFRWLVALAGGCP